MEKPTWLKRLQDASFRGVSFGVQGSEAEFGRHKVTHEFIGSDSPFTEDSGRKAQAFSVTGFVIGSDYMRLRDLLITASEKEGAGRLVHPYFGVKRVECISLSVSESLDYGGMAKLSFSFIEAGEPLYPLTIVDNVLDILETIDQLFNEASLAFYEAFSVLKMPEVVLNSASSLIEDFSSLLSNTNGIGASIRSLSSISETAENLTANSKNLMASPRKLAKNIRNLLETHTNNLSDKKIAIESIFGVSRAFLETKPQTGTTVSKMRQNENLAALKRLIKIQSILVSSSLIVRGLKEQAEERNDTKLISQRESIKLKEIILSEVDNALENTANDQLFSLMSDLRAKIAAYIPNGMQAPETRNLIFSDDTCALVLAYDLYRNLKREQEIIKRNNIKHPGQISPEVTLEILA